MKGSLADVQRLVADLHPTTLAELGLAEALRQYADTVTQRSDGALKVQVELAGLPPSLPAAAEVAACRIILAAVTNVARHARASRCMVAAGVADGRLELAVTDDGRGLPPPDQARGLGLRSMAERAAELGGACTVEAADAAAAVTTACAPGRPGWGLMRGGKHRAR